MSTSDWFYVEDGLKKLKAGEIHSWWRDFLCISEIYSIKVNLAWKIFKIKSKLRNIKFQRSYVKCITDAFKIVCTTSEQIQAK